MGKAKWWVCEGCVSLNDVPANKCYKCHQPKPSDPKLIDDQYSEVGGEKRVGITVNLDKVGDLTRPDPTETAAGGAIMEAFDKTQDPSADVDPQQPTSTPRYDPYAGTIEQPEQLAAARTPAPPKPLREPTKRGIDALGSRMWAEGSDVYADPPPMGAAVAPGAQPPPADSVPPTPPGVAPPPMAPPLPPGAPQPPAAQGRPPDAPPPAAAPRPPVPPPPPGAPQPPGSQGRPPDAPPPPPPAAAPRPPVSPPKPPKDE